MACRILPLLLTLVTLTACGSLSKHAHQPIPPLDPQGDVYKTEGPNDPLIYDSTLGHKKAIMVYVDFPNQPQTIDTKERQAKILDGDTFYNIFAKQSYGKFTIDIDHVHGWRRMPKPSTQYNSDETLPHRDLYIEILALYPEINFLEYDYIMANMNGHGNVAFGARDDEAIPYRGQKINVALNIVDQDPYTLAHETGHLMGLPDLYTYGDLTPKHPTGPWDIMSIDGATGFLGWHRHKFGWLDDDRKTYLTQGTHNLTLAPLNEDRGLSMIAVPTDNPTKPSKVFVIEVAQPLSFKPDKLPRPAGVLIYSVDAKLPTGENPVVVYAAPGKTLIHAAYHEGETFDAEDAPMTVNVLKKNDNGSYRIQVDVKR